MNYCHVEFESAGEIALERLTEFFALLKVAKDDDELADEGLLSAYLTDKERLYFWDPTPAEMSEWNELWFSTPLPKRHSAEMPSPPWHFGSMLEAVSDGDYDLVGVFPKGSNHSLAFNPRGYPYGGTGGLVALAECFGHRVVGIDDGTGYAIYVPRTNVWKPRASGEL
jgi:hypothetical protein